MASYFKHRANWVAPPISPRLFPHQDPTFQFPPAMPHPDDQPVRHSAPRPGPSSTPDAPARPPPMYFPGEAERARRAELARGQGASDVVAATAAGPAPAPSTNVASSRTAGVEWAWHPAAEKGWRRWVRVGMWWRVVGRGEKEELWGGWPVEFGGVKREVAGGGRRGRDDEESAISRTASRRSTGADSGIGLTPRSTIEPQHPLAKVYASRIAHLNETISAALQPTRQWLALLEMLNFAWLVVLIIALAVDRGRQAIFLEAVEVALVVLIVLNGAVVNQVRMKRWSLAKQLRALSRDWTILPTASSTDRGVLANLFDQPAQSVAEREALARRSEPSLRWRMRQTEGSWWLSYRPVIRVELVTPGRSGTSPAVAVAPPVEVEVREDEREVAAAVAVPVPGDHELPGYSA